MKKYIFIVILFFTSISFAQEFSATGSIDVYFSPNGGCTDAIVKEIDMSKSEILCVVYSFDSDEIAKALINASNRNVVVKIIFDKNQKIVKHKSFSQLTSSNIFSYIDYEHNIQHNKYMIIDQDVVITGSFNFAKNAEKNNAENLLILKHNKHLVNLYIKNFEDHKQHSEQYNFVRH